MKVTCEIKPEIALNPVVWGANMPSDYPHFFLVMSTAEYSLLSEMLYTSLQSLHLR